MKDSEFIELLNLYLDHEISQADAARLEAEVQQSPERRLMYQDYCRMQKACSMLVQESTASADAADRRVVAFEKGRSWGFGTYAAGLCAAAACIALVVSVRARFNPIGSELSATVHEGAAKVQTVQSLSSVPRAISRTVSVRPRNVELKSVFSAQSLPLQVEFVRDHPVLGTTDARFDWMRQVHVPTLGRIVADELVFDSKASQPMSGRVFRSHQLIQNQVETTAFQFGR